MLGLPSHSIAMSSDWLQRVVATGPAMGVVGGGGELATRLATGNANWLLTDFDGSAFNNAARHLN